jgi:hypothetical protein
MRKHNKVKIGLQRRIVHLRPEHWEQLHEIIDFKIARVREEILETHKKKLGSLGIHQATRVDDTHVNKGRNRIDEIENETADAIFNSSDRELTEIEKSVLSKGLKFGIKQKRVDIYEIMSRFEELAQSLNRIQASSRSCRTT